MYTRAKIDILGFIKEYEGSVRGEWAKPLILLTDSELYLNNKANKTEDFLLVNETLKLMEDRFNRKELGVHRFKNLLEELELIGISVDNNSTKKQNDQINFMVNLIKQFCNFSYNYYDEYLAISKNA